MDRLLDRGSMGHMTLGEELVARMKQKTPEGTRLKVPPNVFEMMKGEIIDYDEAAQRLVVRFPVQEAYQNPMGMMQGGMIAAAIDNTLGPLSYLAAPPSVTTQLNTTFVRPVTPRERFITVEGWVTGRTQTQLYLSAHVKNASDRLLAIAQATCQIVNKGQRSSAAAAAT